METSVRARWISALLAVHAVVPACALAQSDFPSRQVTLVVGFTPGGTTDQAARYLASQLTKIWKQPVIVENRPGASATLAASYVAKARPDGYTLMVAPGTSMSLAPALYKNLSYDPIKDFTPIALFGTSPQVLVVNPQRPFKSVKDLVAYAKVSPGKLSYGSGGNGSSPHVAGAMMAYGFGLDMTHVPYRGEPNAVNDVLGNQVPVMLSNLPVVLPFIKSGRLTPLAVTSPVRSSLLPGVPTLAESGLPGFDTGTWQGIFAPAALPKEIAMHVNRDLLQVLRQPETSEYFARQGVTLVGNTSEEFSAFLKADIQRWAKDAPRANITAE